MENLSPKTPNTKPLFVSFLHILPFHGQLLDHRTADGSTEVHVPVGLARGFQLLDLLLGPPGPLAPLTKFRSNCCNAIAPCPGLALQPLPSRHERCP